MTAIVEADRRVAINGEVKHIYITTDANCATGHTIDFGSDSAGGDFKKILGTYICEDTGEVKVLTFVQSTGICTAGTLNTGVHEIHVWGI